MSLPRVHYHTKAGVCCVEAWLLELPANMRGYALDAIDLLEQYAIWGQHTQICALLDKDLNLYGYEIGKMIDLEKECWIVCFPDYIKHQLVLLHGFVKDDHTDFKAEIDVARCILHDYLS